MPKMLLPLVVLVGCLVGLLSTVFDLGSLFWATTPGVMPVRHAGPVVSPASSATTPETSVRDSEAVLHADWAGREASRLRARDPVVKEVEFDEDVDNSGFVELPEPAVTWELSRLTENHPEKVKAAHRIAVCRLIRHEGGSKLQSSIVEVVDILKDPTGGLMTGEEVRIVYTCVSGTPPKGDFVAFFNERHDVDIEQGHSFWLLEHSCEQGIVSEKD